MDIKDRIIAKLVRELSPARLEVVDESHLHAGHAGWREGGGTHFRVRIAAAAFDGLSRVAQHRLVNAALAEEMQNGVHALAIEARGA